jgi:hypothetical protein
MKKEILYVLMTLVLVLGLVVPSALASPVEPIFVLGNPDCPDCEGQGNLTSDYSFKIDPPMSGTYTVPGYGTITITLSSDGKYLDWTSTFGISAVIVKGGPNANLYVYNPPAESFGDTGLCSPVNPKSGQIPEISHIVFCYAEGAQKLETITVIKTAETTFTRTWEWTIEKSVSPDTWDLFKGDSGTSEWTVSVTKTGYTDSDWQVCGNITIMNEGTGSATITGIYDEVDGITATVDCGVTFPYVLEAGGNLTCTYCASLPDGSQRLNTATVTTEVLPGGYNGYADVIFGEPTTVVNDTINVTDTNGNNWTTSGNATWTYLETFACDCDEGIHVNTATITETGQYGNATVTVNCYELEVTKTAITSFTRTWDWTIDKSGNKTALTLSPGQQYLVSYEVTGNATYTDSDWAVCGNITVHNPAPIPATINGVTDVINPGNITATVDCGVTFPYTLAAGGTLICTYCADLPDAGNRTNTATVTLQNYDYDKYGNATANGTTDFSGSADVIFGDPTEVVDECIDVTDDQYGFLGTVCFDAAPYTFNYSMWVGNYTECGVYYFTNIASFETNDTQAAGNDTWTVTITVPCLGCTLTPGYWKTHSEYGPAPYDDTWALLSNGADTLFFQSGKTYYQVLWTSPKGGNAYYILAHAYIAAKLNQLNGASIPPAVLTAFNQATWLFDTYTPAQIAALKGNSALRKTFINLAGILDDYNNGITGPGHCDE